MYVVFEGIDGSGKTTLATFLFDYLKKKGYNVYLKTEPFNREFIENTFKKIENIKDKELKSIILTLAFAYDRAFLEGETKYSNFDFVIGDRSFISSLAYQSLNLPLEWIFEVNKFFKKPDLVIYLDLSPEVAIKRIEERNNKKSYYEKIEFLKKIRKNYKKVINFLKKKKINVVVINSEQPLNNVKKELSIIIDKRIFTESKG
ncbi:MAG: dTMP kinase [Nanoarchaeota archaeon]